MKLKYLLFLFFISLLFISFIKRETKVLPKGFVDLSEVIPNIKIDLHYATANNFIGKPIKGYYKNRCILSKEAANALKKVETELLEKGFCLQVYDTYRPQKAVNHFVRWAKNQSDTLMKKRFYPKVAKKDLFKSGYISSKSRHSSGSTIDLSIFSDATNDVIDMGSDYDYFGKASWITYENITKKQKNNRVMLLRIMQKHGFRSYIKEWWHFTLRYEPYRNQYFDFNVE